MKNQPPTFNFVHGQCLLVRNPSLVLYTFQSANSLVAGKSFNFQTRLLPLLKFAMVFNTPHSISSPKSLAASPRTLFYLGHIDARAAAAFGDLCWHQPGIPQGLQHPGFDLSWHTDLPCSRMFGPVCRLRGRLFTVAAYPAYPVRSHNC